MNSAQHTGAETQATKISGICKRGRRTTHPKRLWAACSALLMAFGILSIAQRTMQASVGPGLLIACVGVAALGSALWLFNDYLKAFFD